ncbi:MAG TPA: response regulator transcription factor [Acidimicrobiales bacterium]|nr:response regulator transcription factor [Acidimicrobiales bacterium]
MAIVEDDEEIRSLLELMLEHDDRFEHVGSAADGHAGVALVGELQPDVAVLDLELPGLGGLDAIGLIGTRAPRTKIVVFSGFADPLTLIDVLRLGADAYLDKASAWSELLPTMAALCSRAVDIH